jgi:HTH-type transcriptional regulator, sugar sensing transcriptional regulator
MDKISAALRRIDLSEGEQTIYLSLLRQGRATPRMLADRTGLTRPSVYDQLKTLVSLNLVVELDMEGKAHFAAADIKHLDELLLDKIDRLEQSRQFLIDSLPGIQDSLDTVVPKIRFFEGVEGLKQLMKDVMWHDNITLTAIWNEDEMNHIYDAAFLRWWNERRIVRGIKIVWQVPALVSKRSSGTAKTKTATTTNALTFYDDTLDDIVKLLHPKQPAMTCLIYGSKVACISSQTEAFGFIVESAEFAYLQRMSFMSL